MYLPVSACIRMWNFLDTIWTQCFFIANRSSASEHDRIVKVRQKSPGSPPLSYRLDLKLALVGVLTSFRRGRGA